MLWAPTAIAGFASRAGWRGDELAIAVALVLAGTAGDDLARDMFGSPPVVDRRGLWLVDVVAYPEHAGIGLYDPLANANAAHSLYTAGSRSFDWSPVYRAGSWRDMHDVALEAAKRPTDGQPVEMNRLDAMTDPTVRRAQRVITGLARYVASQFRPGG